jgi:hypothetical protein
MKKLYLICLVSLIGLIGPIGLIKINAATIIDGDLIRAENSVDVYIVKLIPSTSSGQTVKQFKRLILNPEIFNQYGHLKWEDIKTVSQAEADGFIVSDLVRAVNDDKVYKLYPNGDTGEKRWIRTAEDFFGLGFDSSSIYEINIFERDYYTTGADIVFRVTPETPATPETPSIPSRNPITINIPADYSTIQAAINAAISGDTIAVKAGIYNENLVISKSIKLIGEFPTSIIVDGQGNGNAVTITGDSDVLIQRIVVKSKGKYGIYCSSESAVQLTLKNSTLKDSERGLVAENNCRVVMLNNVVYNNRNSANTDGAGILIKNNNTYGVVSEIINNTIDDNYHGIWSENSSIKTMNNIVTSNIGTSGIITNTGIYHSGAGSSDNTYNDVYGNGQEYGGDARAGNGSLVAYPKFLWPYSRDYSLKTGNTDYSPCLDAGNPDFTYNDLIINTKTSRNDMGAYGGPGNVGWNP